MDLISRRAAIDEAEEWVEAVYCDHEEQRERDAIKHVINGIKELPSAQPEPGEWVEDIIALSAAIRRGESMKRHGTAPDVESIWEVSRDVNANT